MGIIPRPAAHFSMTTRRQRKIVTGYILMSEGSDKGTPILMSEDSEPIELGEQYE